MKSNIVSGLSVTQQQNGFKTKNLRRTLKCWDQLNAGKGSNPLHLRGTECVANKNGSRHSEKVRLSARDGIVFLQVFRFESVILTSRGRGDMEDKTKIEFERRSDVTVECGVLSYYFVTSKRYAVFVNGEYEGELILIRGNDEIEVRIDLFKVGTDRGLESHLTDTECLGHAACAIADEYGVSSFEIAT